MSERPTFAPLIWYQDPKAALAWLERAFGFETRLVVDDGKGGVIHSEAWLDDGWVYVVGPPNGAAVSPAVFGGRNTQSVCVTLKADLDAHCERARAAGARIGREPADQPYGARVYTCLDLEDHPWSFDLPIKAMTTQETAAATGRTIKEGL